MCGGGLASHGGLDGDLAWHNPCRGKPGGHTAAVEPGGCSQVLPPHAGKLTPTPPSLTSYQNTVITCHGTYSC